MTRGFVYYILVLNSQIKVNFCPDVIITCTEECKNIPDPARFWAWLAEIFHQSAFLGWAAEHFEGDSRNLAELFSHNSVQ